MTVDYSAAPPLTGPLPLTPPRRPNSVRRTATLDVTWPDGVDAPMAVHGRSRDLHTRTEGAGPLVLDEATIGVRASADRVIRAIESDPDLPQLQEIVGCRAGGRLREALRTTVPHERSAGTPLYLLLDDLSGATLVSGFAFSQWPEHLPAAWSDARAARATRRRMESVCIGFQPGSSALIEIATPHRDSRAKPVSEVNTSADRDERSWHRLEQPKGVSMRRSRRIDVWREGESVVVDAIFQDSSTRPAGGRVAVHEYQLHATADRATLTLQSLQAEPHVLPFPECPLATLNIGTLIGAPMRELRDEVLAELKGVAGCTHLNDALRSLAEVPVLAQQLD